MKEWAEAFYGSRKWRKCRNAYTRKRVGIDGGMCEICHDNIGHIVHHKEHLTKENISDPEVALNEDNLEYVCKMCHDDFEGHGIRHGHKLKPLVVFDSSGMPIDFRGGADARAHAYTGKAAAR